MVPKHKGLEASEEASGHKQKVLEVGWFRDEVGRTVQSSTLQTLIPGEGVAVPLEKGEAGGEFGKDGLEQGSMEWAGCAWRHGDTLGAGAVTFVPFSPLLLSNCSGQRHCAESRWGGRGGKYRSLHPADNHLRTDRPEECPGQLLSATLSSSDILRGRAENEDTSDEGTSGPLTLALAQSSCLPTKNTGPGQGTGKWRQVCLRKSQKDEGSNRTGK